MRNLGYTYAHILLIFAITVVTANGQADCNTFPNPTNDLCGDAIVLLGSEVGNTCCAAIETEDYCGAMENGVWYQFSQTKAHILSISNLGISGTIGVEIYSGSCGALTLEDRSDCSGFDSREFILKECIQDFYIHITSLSLGCGEFELEAREVTDCNFAERCTQITGAQELFPLSDASQECVSSCMQYACNSDCSTYGVWFKLYTDASASTVQIAVKDASFDPIIKVQSGTSCFNAVDIVSCQAVTVNEFITLTVSPNSIYFIEVSYADGNPGPFDLCINSIQDFFDCSNGSLTPIRTMFPGEDPYGPYCPGETITFCYDLEFQVDIPGQGNACQWIQGLVPILGGGWNTNVNTLSSQPPVDWQWFPEGSVDYNDFSNILSLATNQEGNLILEYGAGGIQANDLLPGGWWYTSAGSAIDCTNDGDPDNMYGLEVPCGDVLNFTHCFDLTTKNTNQISGCDDNFNKDLSIKIFNFTDGETGCYSDFTCAGDTPVTFDGKIDCISIMDIVADNKEICSGDFAELAVSFQEDAGFAIEIAVIDPGNTSGAQDWIFEKGKGKIPDQIINLGTQKETITYEARVFNSASNCPTPVETFTLEVLPEIVLDVPTDFLICEGENTSMSAPSGFVVYNWYDIDNNLLSSNQDFVFPGAGDYILEVNNGYCSETAGIAVDVVSHFAEGLSAQDVEVCNFDNGTISSILDLTSFQMAGVNGDWFDADDNPVPDPSQVNFSGVNAQSVLYTFVTSNEPAPCSPSSYNFNITIQECLCPSVELSSPDDACNIDQSIDLDAYKITTENGSWSLQAGPDMGSLDIAGNMLNVYTTTVGGVYTIQFTLDDAASIGACQASETMDIRIVPSQTADIQDAATACNASGASDPVSIDLDDLVLDGTPGSWTTSSGLIINADNTVSFDGEAPGNYVFTFTSSNAQAPCIDQSTESTISVQNCMCPPLDIDAPPNFCAIDNSFLLTDLILNADPGTWSINTSITEDLPEIVNNETLVFTENTSVGNYILVYTLTDPNVPSHCSNSIEYPFEVLAEPYAIIPNEVITCNGGAGSVPQVLNLIPLVTGGSGGGVWSTTATEFMIVNNRIDFNGVPAGFYTITYTTNDAIAPCENTSVDMIVEVEDCRCPQVNFVQFPDLCIGQDTFDLDPYIDTSADGEWYINGIVGTNAIAIINRHYLRYSTFAEPGLYTLSYRLYNFGYPDDCELEFYMDFYIHPIPEAIIKPSARLCNFDAGIGPDEIDLDTMFVSGSPGDWTSPHPEIVVQADNVVSFDGLDAGTYTFYYTTNDANFPCENVEYEMNVIVDDCTCPELSVINPGPLCQTDDRIYLYDYIVNSTGWFGTWTVTGPDGVPLNVEQLDPVDMEPGDYELLFTWAQKPHGTCPDTASAILKIHSEPEVDVVSEVSVCNTPMSQAPECIDLTSLVTGDAGAWVAPANYTNDFSDLTNVCFVGLPPGETYEFTYTTSVAQLPCSDAEGITVVTVEDCSCPILNIIDPDPICNFDGTIDLESLETENISPGFWDVVDGPEQISLSGTILDASNISSGMYTLQYSPDIQPGPSCAPYSQVTLEVVASLEAGQGQEVAYCFDQMDELDINQLLSGQDEGGTWREITIDNLPSESFDEATGILNGVNLAPGKYDFQYHQDNEHPCEDNFAMVSIIINALPEADAGDPAQLNCALEQVVIGGSNTSNGPDYEYNWYSMEGYPLVDNNAPELMVTDPGMYVLQVMNMNTGCMMQDSVEVSQVDDTPQFDIDVISSPCDFEQLGTILAINPVGGDGQYEYSIDQGQTWTTNNAFADLEGGEYSIMIQDGRGCKNEVSEVIVPQSEPIGLYAGEDMVFDYSEELYTIDISVQTDLTNIDSVIWTIDGEVYCQGSVEDCYSIDVDVGEINTYCVTLIDINGCEETDCVVLEEELNVEVYIPNIFSMNDISINNRMFVQSGPYIDKVLEFKIYDRWGSLIFDAVPDHAPNDPDFGWDGRFNYKPVEQGVYIYFIRVLDALGRDYNYRGDITLVR